MKQQQSMQETLFKQVDGSSLAIFRMLFAISLLAYVLQFLSVKYQHLYQFQHGFNFTYMGFAWIKQFPLSVSTQYWMVYAQGIFALMIFWGCFYRLAMIAFTLSFTIIFLQDASYYLNHHYLVILISVLMCIVPANKVWSIDSFLKHDARNKTIPYWALLILLLQVDIVYIYAGLVKINADWLFGQPLMTVFANNLNDPIFGKLFQIPGLAKASGYAVIALHVLGAPLLFYKRTRLFVFCCYVIFHLLNAYLFNVGIFPWVTLFATTLFFEPDWPRRCFKSVIKSKASAEVIDMPNRFQRRCIVTLLVVWTSIQVLLPLRHWCYPGNVLWTDEGFRYSWMMMLRGKATRLTIFIEDNQTGEQWQMKPEAFLPNVIAHYMFHFSDLVLQFAHQIGERWQQRQGHDDISVYFDMQVSMNNREFAPYVDSTVDLMKVEDRLWPPATWILPLTVPIEKQRAVH